MTLIFWAEAEEKRISASRDLSASSFMFCPRLRKQKIKAGCRSGLPELSIDPKRSEVQFESELDDARVVDRLIDYAETGKRDVLHVTHTRVARQIKLRMVK